MKFLRGILLPALLAIAPFTAAKKDKVIPVVKDFDSELVNIFYFEDSEVVVLWELETGNVWRSPNAGKDWDPQEITTLSIIKNPFDNQVAVALGDRVHHITYNRGETWEQFKTDLPPSWTNPGVAFHAGDSKKILYNTVEDCRNAPCIGQTYYTTDGFKSMELLRGDRKMCIWAKSSDQFLLDTEEFENRILCITTGKYSARVKDFRLLISDNYFKDDHEPVMSSGRTVQGMVNMASVKGYLVAAAKSDNSNELALYVTDDTKIWHRAEFGEGKIEEDAYTILESTNYSIQVDVMTSRKAFVGDLYTSNSNGTYFQRNIAHTNRNQEGLVDFEKVSNIQGIVMVNQVLNADELNGPFTEKKLVSKISFDDGRTFDDLKVKDSEKKLHLHSVTDLHNSGRVFSSPAPGIVMGVGNTGKFLGKYTDGDLYVSDDAGVTWEMALKEAHKYEFGNKGSVLVAVFDEGDTNKIMYSLHHGRPGSWDPIDLGYDIRARELTTTPDSTSLKFLLYGVKVKEGGGRKFVTVHLDFAEMHERECTEKDFEEWHARVDENNQPICVMGQEQIFHRRIADSNCFVKEDFQEPLPVSKQCKCDEERDYECDVNFKPHGEGKDKTCEPAGPLQIPEGACQNGETTFMGSSGWAVIPGNKCTGKTKKDEPVKRECDKAKTPAPSGKITSEITRFKAAKFEEYYYLERGDKSKDDDETVVVRTSEREAYITHNHGKEWKKAVDDQIVAIYPHQYNNDYVYFLTNTDKVYYSENRGVRDTIDSFKAPHMPNTKFLQIMQFHPTKSDWIIWVGGDHCEMDDNPKCHTVASVSTKNGVDWTPLLRYVKKCAFTYRREGRVADEQTVFCEQYTNEEMGAPLELISSVDWFKNKDTKFESVVEFATMSEFIIVATKGEDGKSLKLDASLDGTTFADAKFPPKFQVDHQTAYTVLDSSTHSVFLHVTVNPRRDQEYGAIIKSNSNGTSYVMSINNVNRNTDGYVDFEKMQGIEGVAVVNVVANADKVDGGDKKIKKSKITHNDGADWDYLKAPEKDSDNQPYECNVSNKEICSLHLHGYTERADPRETYSSPTAVGIMLGVGNVGESLSTFGEASTFMTTDAGITWKEVKKGNYAWEFGDQGSVIVIVARGKSTDHLYYSTDVGETWDLYKFSTDAITVDAISTVPSDTSLNFMLWGKDGKQLLAVNVDFSGLDQFQNQCELAENDPEAGDYDLWTPQHPMLEDKRCLFGHEAQYHRKKSGVKCKNGRKIDHLHNIARNCSCTRADFEW